MAPKRSQREVKKQQQHNTTQPKTECYTRMEQNSKKKIIHTQRNTHQPGNTMGKEKDRKRERNWQSWYKQTVNININMEHNAHTHTGTHEACKHQEKRGKEYSL